MRASNRWSAAFVVLVWTTLFLLPNASIERAGTCPSSDYDDLLCAAAVPSEQPIKIAVLMEPSPVGSYVCGQSKRIALLLEYLLLETNDHVELITTEVNDIHKPTLWRDRLPIHYTAGMQLPSYPAISISTDWSLRALRELYRMQPNVIHATTPGPLFLPSILAAWSFGIPLVLSCHTHITAYVQTYLPAGIVNTVAEWILWRFLAIVHSLADITLVTSPQVQEEFLQHGIQLVHVWAKGVNTTQFHPRYNDASMRQRMLGHMATDDDTFLLVYIGRLAEEKQLNSLKGVLLRTPGARLCIVGTGPQESELRDYFAGTPTTFLGQITDPVELSQVFASGDIFCMPSTSETLGFVVLESMASGVPVVAANVGGLRHILDDNATGFLVAAPHEDDTEFVRRVHELKADADLRKRIAASARREAERWSWESSMGQVRNHFYPMAKRNFEKRTLHRIWLAVQRWLL